MTFSPRMGDIAVNIRAYDVKIEAQNGHGPQQLDDNSVIGGLQ